MGKEFLLPVTRLLNKLLAKPTLALFALLHIHPAHPARPITNFFAMDVVVFLIGALFFLWLRPRISAERPGATQQVAEMLLTNPMGVGVKDLVDDIVGHDAERHIPLLGSIGIFILLANLAALVPGFESPTADKTVPLGCAVLVFLYYNWMGIAKHGPIAYGKTFMGPVIFISPLMFVIEAISHLARLLSLTVRLWANMMVGEMLYVSFLGLSVTLYLYLSHANPAGYLSAIVPVGIPFVLILFHIFEAVLQAFIFTILGIVYLGMAVAEEH